MRAAHPRFILAWLVLIGPAAGLVGEAAMELFTVVATTLASTAIRSLVIGQPPTGDAWASAVSAVLSEMLKHQATTDETLRRIEQKIDRLAVLDFERSLTAGLRFIEEAQPTWRKWPDRKQQLGQARSYFIEASAAAPDDFSRAIADWYLGLAWLLGRSPRDSALALARARDDAFRALLSSLYEWESPQPRTGSKGAKHDLTSSRKERRSLRHELVPHVQAAKELVAGVQATRRALGDPAEWCSIPQISPDPLPAIGRKTVVPSCTIPLLSGLNDVLGYQLAVHDVRDFEVEASRLGPPTPRERLMQHSTVQRLGIGSESPPIRIIDVDLSVGIAADSKLCSTAVSVEVPFKRSMQEILGSSGSLSGPLTSLLSSSSSASPLDLTSAAPPVPRPQLPNVPEMARPSFAARSILRRMIMPKPGEVLRGWTRFVLRESAPSRHTARPISLVFQLKPFGIAPRPYDLSVNHTPAVRLLQRDRTGG